MKRITPIETIRRRFASADFSEAVASETPLDPCLPDDGNDDSGIPPRIAALIAQREAAHVAAFRPIPVPGQIVRVPPRPDDAGNLYNEYLAVLLDAEIALGKWRGWMVGRDSDYASEWDLILGPEEEPRDPMCQLVQIWNPVSLTIQEADRVLAQLTDERLAAARAMARDHAQKLIPAPIDDNRMGVHLARELADGTGVVTGTSLAPQHDLRIEYQHRYREVALWINQQGAPSATTNTNWEQASLLNLPEERPNKYGLLENKNATSNLTKRWAALIAAIMSAFAFGAITMRFVMMPGMEGVRSEGSFATVDGQKKFVQNVPVFVVEPLATIRVSVGEAARLELSFAVRAVEGGYDLVLEGLIPNSPEQISIKQALGIGQSAGGDLLFQIRQKPAK
ncbi:MAG: hypothetical protein ABIK82_17370 [Pseudomonadota bacterium]